MFAISPTVSRPVQLEVLYKHCRAAIAFSKYGPGDFNPGIVKIQAASMTCLMFAAGGFGQAVVAAQPRQQLTALYRVVRSRFPVKAILKCG